MFHILEVAGGIPVQLHYAHFDEWIIRFRPDLGQVEWVVLMTLGLIVGHDLNTELPARELITRDTGDKVALAAFSIFTDDIFCLVIREIFNVLQATKVKLDPGADVVLADHAECVTAKPMHVAV